jgi:hypothetical protein
MRTGESRRNQGETCQPDNRLAAMVGRDCSSGLRVLQALEFREITVSDQTYATYDRLRL